MLLDLLFSQFKQKRQNNYKLAVALGLFQTSYPPREKSSVSWWNVHLHLWNHVKDHRPQTNHMNPRLWISLNGDDSLSFLSPTDSIWVPLKPTRWWVVEASSHHIYYSEKCMWAAVSRLIRQRSYRDWSYNDWSAISAFTCFLWRSRQFPWKQIT